MKNLRTYGKAPFKVVVIHGGPGVPGQMAPVALELSLDWDVLEPLQTATSLEGQVQELRDVLEKDGALPVTLIGWSWGAMLSFIFSARYPAFVKKLIMVGSGVYEEQYVDTITETRLNRLTEEERKEAYYLMEAMNAPAVKDKNTPFTRLGVLLTKADVYNPLIVDSEDMEVQYHIHRSVWSDAVELRRSGELLKLGRQIQCPVLAIHGDYDPHPHEGIKKSLSAVLDNFRFILLKNCGHIPWIEKEAKGAFYEILKKELR